MEILFHDKSFPSSLSNIDIYDFCSHLRDLYDAHNELQKIIKPDRCYISTSRCKENGAIILQELFNSQRKIKGEIDVSIIRAVVRFLDSSVVDKLEEEFSTHVRHSDAIVTNGYTSNLQQDDIFLNDKKLKNITNIEQFERHKYWLPIKIYESNPKHSRLVQGYLAGKGSVSVMDLDDIKAQEVLNNAISEGDKLYGIYKGKFYEFQCHKDNCWHGYCPNDGIPEKIKRKLTKEL